MKLPPKVITTFLLFPLILLCLSSLVFSQESTSSGVFNTSSFDYSKAYQDYIYNLNLYRQAYQKFVLAKNEHLSYKTLTSETNALETTKEMLEARSQAIIVYLTALKMRLSETTGVLNYQSNLRFVELMKNIDTFETQKNLFPAAATLKDLLKVSSQFENQYSKTEVLTYNTLFTVVSGKENNLRDQIQFQITKLEQKLAQMSKEGLKDTLRAERWLLEAKNKITLSQQKQDEANKNLSKLTPQQKDKNKVFAESQLMLEESNQYLKEAISNLKELVIEIKSE
jgi:hypothetical protein